MAKDRWRLWISLATGIVSSCGLPTAPDATLPYVKGTAPIIHSITATATRVEIYQEVEFTADVRNTAIPFDQLNYDWSAPVGSFIGSGPVVKWHAGSSAESIQTPRDVPITL